MLETSNYEDKTPKGQIDQIISECENTEFACIIFEKLEQIIGENIFLEIKFYLNFHRLRNLQWRKKLAHYYSSQIANCF